ncbi:MAG: alpha/beta hydrolase [Bdellovibrionales bacterium]
MPNIIINGPAGRIEAAYSHSKNPNAPLAVIFHPNPLQGGTMNNKVTYTLFQTFVERGFSVVRYNSRGVGKSQGVFDKGEGELTDAAAILDWIQTLNPKASGLWTAGFSFGSWISMQLLMRRPEIKGFVSVGLPATEYDFTFLAPCPQSGLILNGSKDNIVLKEDVDEVVERLNAQKGISIDYRTVEGANHFFTNHCEQVKHTVHDHLNNAGAGMNVVTQDKELISA